MTLNIERMIAVSGDDVVARWASGVVVLGGSSEEVRAALEVLAPSQDGTSFSEPSADELVERLRETSLTNFAALLHVPEGRRILCSGAGLVTRLESGGVLQSASADHIFEESIAPEPLWLGFGPAPFDVKSLRDSPLRFGDGVITGRGVIVEPAVAEPALESHEPEANEPTAASQPFELADLSTVEPRAPLPEETINEFAVTVKGIVCARGHFNNPNARYCSSCGLSLVHLTHKLVDGERPPLGFLVFDDGSTFTLDRSYRIGREPEGDADFVPLIAADAENSLSRSHAEVALDGWDVTLCDLGSTNGTFVWDTERNAWNQVMPNRPVVIAPGSRIAVGHRSFVFESIDRDS